MRIHPVNEWHGQHGFGELAQLLAGPELRNNENVRQSGNIVGCADVWMLPYGLFQAFDSSENRSH